MAVAVAYTIAMRPQTIPPALDGIVVVMDRPQDIANVGGAIRAMGNFGLARLRLVEPAAFDEERIRGIAHRGAPIVQRLERYSTLGAALADCGYVLGTTARPRAVRHERMTPRQAASALLHAGERATSDASFPPAALLFGTEDRGLTNDALGFCNALITIPTAPHDSSLNLAQAILLIAYELWLAATTEERGDTMARRIPDAVAALDGIAAAGSEPPARIAAREEMYAALEDVLWGMHPNNDAGRVGHTLARLRALLSRAAPRSEEVDMLRRLFVHIAHERKE